MFNIYVLNKKIKNKENLRILTSISIIGSQLKLVKYKRIWVKKITPSTKTFILLLQLNKSHRSM